MHSRPVSEDEPVVTAPSARPAAPAGPAASATGAVSVSAGDPGSADAAAARAGTRYLEPMRQVLEGRVQMVEDRRSGTVRWTVDGTGEQFPTSLLDWLLEKQYVVAAPHCAVSGWRAVTVTPAGLRFYGNGML